MNEERETIISSFDNEDVWHICTSNSALVTIIKKLGGALVKKYDNSTHVHLTIGKEYLVWRKPKAEINKRLKKG